MPADSGFFSIPLQLNKDRYCPEGFIVIVISLFVAAMLVISKVLLYSFLHLITKRIFQKVSSLESIPNYIAAFHFIPIYGNALSNLDAVLCFP